MNKQRNLGEIYEIGKTLEKILVITIGLKLKSINLFDRESEAIFFRSQAGDITFCVKAATGTLG